MKFTKGRDFRKREGAIYTYGINVDSHLNGIEVYGDEELRDLILELLTEHYREE